MTVCELIAALKALPGARGNPENPENVVIILEDELGLYRGVIDGVVSNPDNPSECQLTYTEESYDQDDL